MEEGGVSSEFIYSYSFITKNFCTLASSLTHWGQVMHICISKFPVIGSDNGLFPERCQAIICTNAGILLIGPLGTNFNEILSGILTSSLKNIRLKVSPAKWWPFCLSLNVLTFSMLTFLFSWNLTISADCRGRTSAYIYISIQSWNKSSCGARE